LESALPRNDDFAFKRATNSGIQMVYDSSAKVYDLTAIDIRHQMITYLTSRSLSDAQIQLISGHESKKSLEIYQHLSLGAVEQAYQEAVQSVSILMDTQRCQNHNPLRLLVPLLEFNEDVLLDAKIVVANAGEPVSQLWEVFDGLFDPIVGHVIGSRLGAQPQVIACSKMRPISPSRRCRGFFI
jgi:hypothetical protein